MDIYEKDKTPLLPPTSASEKQEGKTVESPSQKKMEELISTTLCLQVLPTSSEKKISAQIDTATIDKATTDFLLFLNSGSRSKDDQASEAASKNTPEWTVNEFEAEIKKAENALKKTKKDSETIKETETTQSELSKSLKIIEFKKNCLKEIKEVLEKLETTIAHQDEEISIIQDYEKAIKKIQRDLISEMNASKEFLERLDKEILNLNKEIEKLSNRYEKLQIEPMGTMEEDSKNEKLRINLESQEEIIRNLSAITHTMNTKAKDLEAISTKMQQLELDVGKTYEVLQIASHTLNLLSKQLDTNKQTYSKGLKYVSLLEREIEILERARGKSSTRR